MHGNRMTTSEVSVFKPEDVFDKIKSEMKPFFDNQGCSHYNMSAYVI